MANSDQNTPISTPVRYTVSPPCSNSPCSMPTSPPWDSGYDSQIITPERPRSLPDVNPYTLDGNSSDPPSRLFLGDQDDTSVFLTPVRNVKSTRHSYVTRGEEAANLPRPVRGHFRSSLSSAFFSAPASKSALLCGSYYATVTTNSSPSALQPDRFVHPRDSATGILRLSDKFHLTKLASALTPSERVSRHSNASPDVFSPARSHLRHSFAIPDGHRDSIQESGILPQTRIRTTLGSVDHNSELEPNVNYTSNGSVWSLGAPHSITGAIDDGHGNLIQSGTNAPYYTSRFVHATRQTDEKERHQGRLAAALGIDLASRLMCCNLDKTLHLSNSLGVASRKTAWNGTAWVNEESTLQLSKKKQTCPSRPLRILSAPELRDDFYCSVLAYSPACETIAVGLGDLLYRWTEDEGAKLLNGSHTSSTWVTSLAFSSCQGKRSILAFGRSNNVLGLLSMHGTGLARFVVQESVPVSCLSWRPTCTMRQTKNPHKVGTLVETEDLLVGNDIGNVLYYVVEWPDTREMEQDDWRGEMTLVAQVSVHYQQICGLAWSTDGQSFATGSNDNMCCFFQADNVLPKSHRPGGDGKVSSGQPREHGLLHSDGSRLRTIMGSGNQVRELVLSDRLVRRVGLGVESWRWEHGAAVKAIAFCPWQEGLVATGGGSNDKCIHFFHTTSGTALATIFVSSQITSLIWSNTKREIAATFGFVHPGHAVRIAVYSWPDCKQVNSIEWDSDHRALYGVSCAREPLQQLQTGARKYRGRGREGRTLKEGCIAVASSDESIKFYELWPSEDQPVVGGVGMLGGSDILEDLEGIQKEGDIIR